MDRQLLHLKQKEVELLYYLLFVLPSFTPYHVQHVSSVRVSLGLQSKNVRFDLNSQ